MKSTVSVIIENQRREFKKCIFKPLTGQSYLFECWESYEGERHGFYIMVENEQGLYNCHVEEVILGTDEHYSYKFDHRSLVVNGKRVERVSRSRCNYMIPERIA